MASQNLGCFPGKLSHHSSSRIPLVGSRSTGAPLGGHSDPLLPKVPNDHVMMNASPMTHGKVGAQGYPLQEVGL